MTTEEKNKAPEKTRKLLEFKTKNFITQLIN